MSIDSPKFENNPIPEDKKDPWETGELEQLKQGDRSAALVWESEEAKKFAEENNLDLIELPPPIEGLESPNRYVIAKKEKTADILEEKISAFGSGEASEEVKNLYAKIKEMSVAEAMKFLTEQPFGDDGKEPAEVAIVEGLMFGYKPCDVEYYVNTRYFGEEKHPDEDIGYDKYGYVVCQKCAEKEPKIEKREERKEPIVDIEMDKSTLEEWEKLGLSEEVGDLVCGFEYLVPPGEKFSFHAANFDSTSRFMEKTERDFSLFTAKNKEKKIKEVEDSVRKAILNFAFKELEFDVKNPEIVKTEEIEEKIKGKKGKLIVKYFKTNQPNMFLVFDGIDWWLEQKEKRTESNF